MLGPLSDSSLDLLKVLVALKKPVEKIDSNGFRLASLFPKALEAYFYENTETIFVPAKRIRLFFSNLTIINH